MADQILTVSGLGKRFGGFVALEGIDLAIERGERLGLIGPNGSGKSTLVNCLCGTLHNETGSVLFEGKPLDGLIAHERTRLGLARSFQLPKPFHSMDLVDNIRIPLLYTVNARHGGHRLVGEQQSRLGRHRARQFELAHLDLGQVARPTSRLLDEIDMTQQFLAALDDRRTAQMRLPVPRIDRVKQRDADIIDEV